MDKVCHPPQGALLDAWTRVPLGTRGRRLYADQTLRVSWRQRMSCAP
jgi:hypothetical protein